MSTTFSQSQSAYTSLMNGLTELDFQGSYVPCDLVLIGDYAFPLAMNSQGQVLMAASLYGRGRIVVFGHEGYLTTFPTLVENALTWLRGDGSDNLSVGVQVKVKAVADNLRASSSFQPQEVEAFSGDLDVGVYVTDAYSVGTDTKDLVAFLKAGGGVLIGGQAWDWTACNPKKNTLFYFPGNKVSGVAGIYFSENQAAVERLPVYPEIPSSWLAIVTGKNFEDDLQFLLHGISELVLENVVASDVLVHGSLAFPIATNQDGQAFLAGAYYGQGRVIVVTHECLLERETLAPFWKNAIHWLDEGRQGVIGVVPQLNSAFNLLSKFGFQCEKTNLREDLSVFVCTAYSDAQIEEIQHFVAEGGGLLMGGHGWYFAQTHLDKNVITDFAGNKILNKMGLSLLKDILPLGTFKAAVPGEATEESYRFLGLLRRFAAHVAQGDDLTDQEIARLKKLAVDCSTFLHMKAHDSAGYMHVISTLMNILKKAGLPQVCADKPTKSPKDLLLLHVAAVVHKVCTDPDALLPYLVKDNSDLTVVRDQTIEINVNTAEGEEWVSTGLYLAPGMKTYISLPEELINKGWQVQISCQTDYLNAEELKRAPTIHEHFPVVQNKMQVSNLWGGLIYLVAPPKTKVNGAMVTVEKAVPSPYYKSGVTLDDWALMRTMPSPWAELEFENVIITVPSEFVRDLERPDLLGELWDKIMKGIADLAVIPHKFGRKERFVSDVQISAGWMHAGYPVMIHLPSSADMVSLDIAKLAEQQGLWGPIHELGHNQQKACWEFPPHTTECTCNLWSVYVHEEVLGINMAKAHPDMKLENRKSRTKEYVKGGRNLNSWQMWVALETYIQLQETFGWDAFKKVFAAYHKMSDFPKDNKGKMNLYAETFSQAVEKNLTGFFKAWGWPIETTTEEKLSNLPPWTDHPMVEYD